MIGCFTKHFYGYLQSNANFALTVEPQNDALQSRFEKVKQLRQKGLPTVTINHISYCFWLVQSPFSHIHLLML